MGYLWYDKNCEMSDHFLSQSEIVFASKIIICSPSFYVIPFTIKMERNYSFQAPLVVLHGHHAKNICYTLLKKSFPKPHHSLTVGTISGIRTLSFHLNLTELHCMNKEIQ